MWSLHFKFIWELTKSKFFNYIPKKLKHSFYLLAHITKINIPISRPIKNGSKFTHSNPLKITLQPRKLSKLKCPHHQNHIPTKKPLQTQCPHHQKPSFKFEKIKTLIYQEFHDKIKTYPWVRRSRLWCAVPQIDNKDNKLALLIRTGWFLLSPSRAKLTSSTCSIISPNSWASINVDVAAIDGAGARATTSNSLLPILALLGFRTTPFGAESSSNEDAFFAERGPWDDESRPYGSKSKAEAPFQWDEESCDENGRLL